MKFGPVTENEFFQAAIGAALTALCGLALWQMKLGERWVDASYDYLFRFGSRMVTNELVLILMDNDAYERFHQMRGQPWDRAWHAKLLNKLAEDGSALVVFDAFFRRTNDPAADQKLVQAMRRHGRVVLMADQVVAAHPDLISAHLSLPAEPFLSAANTNWGVAWLRHEDDPDQIVRQHWPFPAPGPYPSLPWTAALLTGAKLSPVPQKQWLRYYGANDAWKSLSYGLALDQATNYFRDKIVFIGNRPSTPVWDHERDEFRTPYTRWTGQAAAGVEILATSFLNLINGDWLRRPAWWMEALLLVATGVLFGGGLCLVRPLAACALATLGALCVMLGAVSWSYYSNYWFPWLVIAAGQAPCALACSLVAAKTRREAEPRTVVIPATAPGQAQAVPHTPDYELFDPPFGEGAYGKVWLARNAIGQWQALKAVYLARFGQNAEPYEREFRGIKRYKPVSDKHPGLLRVDFVSRKKPEGYFYYVMELGDGQTPAWEKNPTTYKPRDLACLRAQADGLRLPSRDCVRIGLALAEALDFLHGQGLTHRDIKPQNIILVNGSPKLADVGLVAEVQPPDCKGTLVGTPGYMPPAPEPPGTPQADIYALGMVLYVMSTGRTPALFPELSTTLLDSTGHADFMRLNAIIVTACQPDCALRYGSAVEMHDALQEVEEGLE